MPTRPAPTDLKIVRGDRKSRVNTRGPKVDPGLETPKPPTWMSAGAKRVWRDLAPEMHKLGLLKPLYRPAFGVFCTAVARYAEAVAVGDEDGILVDGKRASETVEKVKNPSLQIERDQAMLVLKAAAEFGLTPSAASGIVLPDTEENAAARRLLA